MESACSTHGRGEKCINNFSRKGKEHLEDLNGTASECEKWLQLAQDRSQ
jgi:hypothetical protein